MTDILLNPEAPAWSQQASIDELEQRVQRLEDATAALCDTGAIEERVRARVLDQLRPEIERLKEEVAQSAVATRTAALIAENTVSGSRVLPLLRDIWDDIATLYRLIRDPQFPASWAAKVIPLFALGYVAITPWVPFWPAIPFLGFADDLVITYLGFKVLGRELRRYRRWLSGLNGGNGAEP